MINGVKMQFYFGEPLNQVKAKVAHDTRTACVTEILNYAATLPDASAAPYRHAAELLIAGPATPGTGST